MLPWLQLGDLRVPIFYLVQSLNLCLIFFWVFRRAPTSGLPARRALDLVFLLAVAGLLGGRLMHVLWEAPEYYRIDPWRFFDFAAGGFVYYGGLLFALGAGVLFLGLSGEKQYARWFDFFAPVLSLATAIGRLGCLFAGCCYGRICTLPWAITIMDENGRSLPRHPAPLYTFIWEFGVLSILLGYEKKGDRRPGTVFALWAVLHGVGRFFIEFIRDDFRGPALAGFSLGQVLSLALIAAGGAWLLRGRLKNSRN